MLYPFFRDQAYTGHRLLRGEIGVKGRSLEGRLPAV